MSASKNEKNLSKKSSDLIKQLIQMRILTKMKLIDSVTLEMRMASIMAQQEASGFRFDLTAAERVRGEFEQEMSDLQNQISKRFIYVPGGLHT